MKIAIATLIGAAILSVAPAAHAGSPITPCGHSNIGQNLTTQHPTGARNWECREDPPGIFGWVEVH